MTRSASTPGSLHSSPAPPPRTGEGAGGRGFDKSAPDDLDDLIEEITARVQAGQSVDIEEYIQEHPEHADHLRRLLPALQVLADLGRSADLTPRPPSPTGKGETVSPLLLGQGEGSPLGDFRIKREVGRGGMGVVYEAEQISLGRRVALKVLPFAATMDPRQLQRFQNEARAAASLEHPHIVPVYGVGCERSVHYYAMKFIDGQSLAQVIAEMRSEPGASATGRQALLREQPVGEPANVKEANHRGTEDTEKAQITAASSLCSLCLCGSKDFFKSVAELGIQAATALEHAHQMGIIHRDIKPANLLIENSSTVTDHCSLITDHSPPHAPHPTPHALRLWITDFGLARTAADAGLTMTGDVLGTLRYMSPEQALAKHGLVDHRTDIYSLGVTLYELVTGTPAVAGKDREQILNAIMLDEPSSLRSLDSAIPHDLETIILKAMAKSATDRYGTARELADDLRRFLEDKPIRAKRPTLLQCTRKWVRRHMAAVWSASACIIVAGVALAGSAGWVLRDRQARRADISQQAWDSLAAAKVLIADNRLDMSRRKIAEAQAQIKNDRAALPGLAAEVDALAADLDRFQEFLEWENYHANEPALGSHIHYCQDPAADASKVLKALSRFGVSEETDWSSDLGGGVFGPDQVERIRRTAYEQLLWLADDIVRRREDHRTHQPLSPDLAGRQGLVYLEKAKAVYHPTSAFFRLRSGCWESLGEKEPALADAQLAHKTPGTIALDYNLLGQQAYAARNKAEAARQFEAALRVEPTHYWSLMWLGATYKDLATTAQDFEAARAAYTGCILRRPGHAPGYACRGDVWLSMGQYQRTIEDCSKAVEMDPKSGQAWGLLVEAYIHLGEWEKAIAAISKRMDLEKQPPTLIFLLFYDGAILRLQMGDTDGYRTICATMFECFENSANDDDAWFTVWACSLHPNSGIDATRLTKLGEKLAAKRPMSIRYLTMLGAAFFRAGRLEEAIKLLTEANSRKFDPRETSQAYIWFLLAMAHHGLGHYPEARSWLEKATHQAEQELQLPPSAARPSPGTTDNEDGSTLPWNRKLTLQFFRREAETALGPTKNTRLERMQ